MRSQSVISNVFWVWIPDLNHENIFQKEGDRIEAILYTKENKISLWLFENIYFYNHPSFSSEIFNLRKIWFLTGNLIQKYLISIYLLIIFQSRLNSRWNENFSTKIVRNKIIQKRVKLLRKGVFYNTNQFNKIKIDQKESRCHCLHSVKVRFFHRNPS